MKTYVGLDVSLKETSICIVDETGVALKEGVVVSDPDLIVEYLAEHSPMAQRVGLESGPTSRWLWRELEARGLPAICIDARHASAALSMQINKSDRNDALGLARIMQTGWFRRVQVKSEHSHRIRALLNARSLLVQMRRDLENQIRGLFKSFGLIIGRANGGVFLKRALDVSQQAPELAGIAGPLLAARADIDRQRLDLERQIKRLARGNAQSRAFMTVPGVGPMTALAFLSGIDDPARFTRSRTVGAYLAFEGEACQTRGMSGSSVSDSICARASCTSTSAPRANGASGSRSGRLPSPKNRRQRAKCWRRRAAH